jgi:hypothetical protein
MAGRLDLRPSTRARDESYLRNYIIPAFGTVPLAGVEADAIDAWIAGLEARSLAPATIR